MTQTTEMYAQKLGNNADQWEVGEGGTGRTIAVTYNDPGGANAHLLAASGEMRESLEALTTILQEMWAEKELTAPKFRQCQLGVAVKEARAALSRAKHGA